MKCNTGNRYAGKKLNSRQKREIEQIVHRELIEKVFGYIPTYLGGCSGNEETKQEAKDADKV